MTESDDSEARAALAVLGPEFDLPPTDAPLRPYVICASPRSGSTLLTTLLHGTGRMGVPAEYFNPIHLQPKLGARFGVSVGGPRVVAAGYLSALAAHRTSANGVFGAKILLSQMQSWIGVPQFRDLLARSTFLWLRRRDKQAQALSLVLAQATQVWHRDRDAAPVETVPRFSAGEMRRALGIVLAEDFAWREFFTINGVHPISVAYEDLVTDPDVPCRALAEALGVPDLPRLTLQQAVTRPTAGEANAVWRRQWRQSLRFRRDRPAG
ncbi:Stf0 family sulfotransferase [Stella sp.]|uniref:Stf0 family sulfotransferase n=1 Tax=Stella sp. TaxID=2912054 RepID=UPI0035AFD059